MQQIKDEETEAGNNVDAGSLKGGKDQEDKRGDEIRKGKVEIGDESKSSKVAANYSGLVRARVESDWTLPEFAEKTGLEAIIVIKVLKNGEAVITQVEKSSGNSLFDRSAKRAINEASPFPPPPPEIEREEIVLTFR